MDRVRQFRGIHGLLAAAMLAGAIPVDAAPGDGTVPHPAPVAGVHGLHSVADAGVPVGVGDGQVDGRTVFPGPGWPGAVRLSLLALGVLAGLAALRLAAPAFQAGTSRRGARLAGLLGVTLLAGALRIGLSPHAFLHEYYHHGLYIHELLVSPGYQANYGETGPAFYRLADFLFGGTERAVFSVNALFATLTVPAVVALDLALFGRWPRALFAGLFLAVLPQHLRFSGAEDPVIPATLFAVASAAFALRWVDGRGAAALVGTVATCALAMQSRTELMAWPAFLALLLLAARGRAFLAALVRPGLPIALGALLLLVGPRLAQVVHPPVAGIPGLVLPTGLAGHLAALLNPFDPMHRFVLLWPSVTPPFLWALVAAGCAWAWTRARRSLAGLLAVVVGYVVLTSLMHSNPQFLVRTQVFCTPWWAVLAAGALPFAVELGARARRTVPARAAVAAAIVLAVAGLATHRAWVAHPTEAWQEFQFLSSQVPLLPRGARILTVVDPGTRDLDAFPAFLLARHGRTDVRLIDLRSVLDGRTPWPEPGSDLLFLQGMFCHFAFRLVEPPPDGLAPRCRAVHERYRLVPGATALLDGAPGSFLAYANGGSGPWEVGLFHATGWRAHGDSDRQGGHRLP